MYFGLCLHHLFLHVSNCPENGCSCQAHASDYYDDVSPGEGSVTCVFRAVMLQLLSAPRIPGVLPGPPSG